MLRGRILARRNGRKWEVCARDFDRYLAELRAGAVAHAATA